MEDILTKADTTNGSRGDLGKRFLPLTLIYKYKFIYKYIFKYWLDRRKTPIVPTLSLIKLVWVHSQERGIVV